MRKIICLILSFTLMSFFGCTNTIISVKITDNGYKILDRPADFKVKIVDQSEKKFGVIVKSASEGNAVKSGDYDDKDANILLINNSIKTAKLNDESIPYFTEGTWIYNGEKLKRQNENKLKRILRLLF